jgi:hypothetical protein
MMVFEYESIPQLTWWRHIPAVTPLERGVGGGGGGGNWIGMGPERSINARKLTRIGFFKTEKRRWLLYSSCTMYMKEMLTGSYIFFKGSQYGKSYTASAFYRTSNKLSAIPLSETVL